MKERLLILINQKIWKKNSEKYRARGKYIETQKARKQQIHLLEDLLDGVHYELDQSSVGLFPLVMLVYKFFHKMTHQICCFSIFDESFYEKTCKPG